MRTPLACTLRVTISPWKSLPTFLKEPMLAMSLLLAVSSPRPPRPRWRSTGRGRSTTHPLAGRSAAEDDGGEPPAFAGACFLASRGMGRRARGRKWTRRRCGSGDRGEPVFGQIKPKRGQALACAEQHPEKTSRTSIVENKGAQSSGVEKES